MKVLFIGGTGILSTDSVNLSLEKGYDVYIINRGHGNNNLDKRIKVIIADIYNKAEVKEKIKDMYFDVVVDYLSYTEQQLKDKLEVFNNKCNQYIFISSATVYRKTKRGEKITEETEASNTEWDYSENKIKCEKELEQNYKNVGQKYTIIRPYVTYSVRRIPYAIISYQNWTLANRMLCGKPIILWDGGEAICTLTQTKDFAVGIVGLFLNEKAYGEAFHITTDYTLTWKEATECIENALGVKANIANIPSDYIIKFMPEYKGTLKSDKGIDREFDNSKIKRVVPEFNAQTKFEAGIKETIKFYRENESRQKIDYMWDGRIDRLVKKFYKDSNIKYDKKSVSIKGYKVKIPFKDKIKYYIGKNILLYNLFNFAKKLR